MAITEIALPLSLVLLYFNLGFPLVLNRFLQGLIYSMEMADLSCFSC